MKSFFGDEEGFGEEEEMLEDGSFNPYYKGKKCPLKENKENADD